MKLPRQVHLARGGGSDTPSERTLLVGVLGLLEAHARRLVLVDDLPVAG